MPSSLLNSLKLDLLRAALILTGMQLKRARIYASAYKFLDTDPTPRDLVPDEYGCAEAVSVVLRHALPELDFPIITYTPTLLDYFKTNKHFAESPDPAPGSIVIAATGTGNGSVPNGHTGVIGRKRAPDGSYWVLSNNSYNGKLQVTHSLNQFIRYYETKGGMKVRYFNAV